MAGVVVLTVSVCGLRLSVPVLAVCVTLWGYCVVWCVVGGGIVRAFRGTLPAVPSVGPVCYACILNWQKVCVHTKNVKSYACILIAERGWVARSVLVCNCNRLVSHIIPTPNMAQKFFRAAPVCVPAGESVPSVGFHKKGQRDCLSACPIFWAAST